MLFPNYFLSGKNLILNARKRFHKGKCNFHKMSLIKLSENFKNSTQFIISTILSDNKENVVLFFLISKVQILIVTDFIEVW
jgi:hypothetical protein